MKLQLFILLIFTLVGCTEIPQGNIVDQGTGFLDQDIDDVIDDVPTRPENQIFINQNYCACRGGQPVNVSTNCTNTCSGQASTDQTVLLFLDVSVGAALQNSQFVNLQGWCTQLLLDPSSGNPVEVDANPDCELVFTNKETNVSSIVPIDSTLNLSGNSLFRVPLSTLTENTNYFFTIRDTVSQIESDAKDLTIRTESVDTLLDIPLTIEPIAQYACLNKVLSTDNNSSDVFSEAAEKVHFYYDAENRPDPEISTTNDNINCHATRGTPTNFTPLLDNTPGQIQVWRKGDIRFGTFRNDAGVEVPDTLNIDMILTGLFEEISGLSLNTTIRLFNQFNYFTDPISASEGQQTLMGYIMTTLQDPNTSQWYCPTSEHYYAANADPLMKALREVVVHDTQPIYFAKQQDKDSDFIFITREDVKNAWFYLNENNQEVSPTSSNIRGKKIQFYWPISEDTPLVKKSHQVVYTIQDPSGVTNPADIPDDKRIGCVPFLGTSN